ncbi:MAG: RDD family protein [Candidatus Nanopelagicales bacterium]
MADRRADLGADEPRGVRLGLPAEGPGAVAGLGRRFAALAVDWIAAILLSRLFFPQLEYGGPESAAAILTIFGAEVFLLTWLTGASFGQRILGVAVIRVPVMAPRDPSGQPVRHLGVGRTALRTLLLCLVIPAVVIDRDGRGLHDRAAGSVVVRARS